MELQDFSLILRGDPVPITLLADLVPFWESHPSFWFSHTPLTTWPTVQTTYRDTKEINMSLVLQYDQIFRHPNPNIRPSDKPVAFRFATQMAFHILHTQWEECKEWERVFVLLALRHNASPLKEFVLRRTLEEADSPLWYRFLKATIWDVHCWKEATVGYPVEPVFPTSDLNTFGYLLQSPQSHPPVELDAAPFRSLLAKQTGTRIAVSISGGVDSMVAAWIAKSVCKELGKDLILLHVSYNNRGCCADECNLLRSYSQFLRVPLYIRQITEMRRVRNSGLRAVYEEVTRQIRFAFYRYFACPVILGHNLDDCFENVFQNLSKQIHFENLFGMQEVGVEQGVTILRPMLNMVKRDIVSFADLQGIPHLEDSTPAWSKRGQMRDRLIPGIQQFDPQILVGLKAFVERSRFLANQWSLTMDTWCKDPAHIPRDAFFESNRSDMAFWIRLFQSMQCRPSNKSLANFMDMLERRPTGQCNLSGSLRATWTHEELCIIMNSK